MRCGRSGQAGDLKAGNSHCCGFVVTIMVLPLLSHYHGVVIAVSSSPSLLCHHHHCFVVAIAALLSLSLLCCCCCCFVVTITVASSWCCSCYCGIAFIVAVLCLSLHCHGVELIGTAERAVTAKPEALNGGLGLLSHWPLRVLYVAVAV